MPPLVVAAADAAADEMAHLLTLVRPQERRTRAHAYDDCVLLARKGKTARADGGKFLDLDGLYPVNITLDIRRADAGERNMADIGELELVRREKVAHRAVE